MDLPADQVLCLAAFALYYILIGALLSLPSLIPRVRARLMRNQTARMGSIVILGAFSLTVSSVVIAFVSATVRVYFSDALIAVSLAGPTADQKEIMASANTIAEELWLRDIFPPPLQHECILRVSTICEYADEVTARMPVRAGQSWSSYFGQHSWGAIAMATTVLTVLLLTRRRSMF